MVLEGDEGYCAGCAERRRAPPSPRAKLGAALQLATVVLCLCIALPPPLGLISLLAFPTWGLGLALSLAELRRAKATAEPKTERWARAGTLAALLTVLLAIAPLVVFATLLLHG